MTEAAYDVAIVGYGPAGVVLAGLLAQRGLQVFVCDRSHDIYDKPRAFALDHEIMRVFQELGVADAVLAFAEPFTPSEYYGVDGQLIKCFASAEAPFPFGFDPALVFNQPAVEQVLRDAVSALPGVDVALGLNLLHFVQDEARVTLQLEDRQGGRREVSANYLIGCDGATSTVRAQAGITLEDLGFDQPWLVVDVLANAQGLAKLPKTSLQLCEPQRPTTFLIGPRNHRRWEISLNEGEDPQQMCTDAAVWKLLSRWITPDDAQLWRQAAYRFHALVASRWRVGRVFIAGDAAHQQPPFLGQGMCQGVRDVANLAWKLAAVCRDEAGDALLDTYGEERKAHVTELTTRIKSIGQLVGERDPVKARERDARLLAEGGGRITPQPRHSVQPALTKGFLASPAHPPVGTLFPQPWVLQSGIATRLDEVFGYGWRVVFRDAPTRQQQDLPGRFQSVRFGDGGLQECEAVVENWFRKYPCHAAILRPDHYVWGVAASPAELQGQMLALQNQFEFPSPKPTGQVQ